MSSQYHLIMSDLDFEIINTEFPENSRIYGIDNSQFVRKTEGIAKNIFSLAVPMTAKNRLEVIKFVLEYKGNFKLDYVSIYKLCPNTAPNIITVLVSIEAYYNSKNPVIPKEKLFSWAFLPGGATELKHIRTKSFFKLIDAKLYEKPDWYKETEYYPINDIGDIFNYRYCFHWEEIPKEGEEDWREALKPVKFKTSTVEKFKIELNDMLRYWKPIEPIVEKEILLTTTGSSSLKSNGRKVPNYENYERYVNFSKRTPGSRVLVQVCPEGARDAIVNSLPDYFRIIWIERDLSNLLQRNSDQIVPTDSNEFSNKMKKFFESKRSFICRDLVKEGITKPRILLKIMLEALHNRFPDFESFSNTDFYEGEWLLGQTTLRGHGLGMANSLTTLMQLVIFNMFLKKCGKEELDPSAFELLAHNDDMIIGSENIEENLPLICEIDSTICENLGLLVSPKKSFSSTRGGVFCEQYRAILQPFINAKESYILRESFLTNLSSNITHAKSVFANLSRLHPKIVESSLPFLLEKWGREFYYKEADLPLSVGGWTSSLFNGCDFILDKIKDVYDHQIINGYFASKNNRINMKKIKNGKKPFLPSLLKVIPGFPIEKIPNEIALQFEISSTYNVKNKFSRLRYHPASYTEAWEILKENRAKIYKNNVDIPITDFAKGLVQSEFKNFFLLPWMIEKTIPIVAVPGKFRDPYTSNNPKLSALAVERPELHYTRSYYPLMSHGSGGPEERLSANARLELPKFIPEFEFKTLDEGVFILPFFEEDMEIFCESYPHPWKMSWYSNKNFLPIPYEEYRNKKNKLKKDIWGRYLSSKEVMLFQSQGRFGVNVYKGFKNFFTYEEILEVFDWSMKAFKNRYTESYEVNDPDDPNDPDIELGDGALRDFAQESIKEAIELYKNYKIESENDSETSSEEDEEESEKKARLLEAARRLEIIRKRREKNNSILRTEEFSKLSLQEMNEVQNLYDRDSNTHKCIENLSYLTHCPPGDFYDEDAVQRWKNYRITILELDFELAEIWGLTQTEAKEESEEEPMEFFF